MVFWFRRVAIGSTALHRDGGSSYAEQIKLSFENEQAIVTGLLNSGTNEHMTGTNNRPFIMSEGHPRE